MSGSFSESFEAPPEDDAEPRYVHSDQTYIVFDVDQAPNPSETIHIKKLGKKGLVAFRFMTNAPTRYLVKPNSGVLENNNPLKVKIELHGNRYNPQHVLILQAVEVFSKDEGETVWESRNLDRDCIQQLSFTLGTTLIDVDKVTGFTDTSKQTQDSVAKVLRVSRAKGADKKKELEDLLEMLKTDNGLLLQNIEQTTRLKNIIKAQIKKRRDLTGDKLMKVVSLEKEQEDLSMEISGMEGEIQMIYGRFRVDLPQRVNR
ncbi:Major sperm protein [Trichostrongylus colubriformis]|uniref:Major sperm protein n=1 Tax=Trichostrongylus colubriformis TaxID=6319 RepID=A0AAN8F284_TRICO